MTGCCKTIERAKLKINYHETPYTMPGPLDAYLILAYESEYSTYQLWLDLNCNWLQITKGQANRIFEDFKDEFLLRDVQGHLTRTLLNPFTWFSRKGRTERAVEYYNKILIHDATFGDMMQPGRPMIIVNASDLAYGVRFSFIQDYFNFLCTDVRDFPVASAVAASSAVPVVFNPVVVENFASCEPRQPAPEVLEMAKHSDELAQTLEGLESYND